MITSIKGSYIQSVLEAYLAALVAFQKQKVQLEKEQAQMHQLHMDLGTKRKRLYDEMEKEKLDFPQNYLLKNNLIRVTHDEIKIENVQTNYITLFELKS